MDLKIEIVDIQQIRPYANNAKEHSEKQIAQIAESIRQFGFNNPVLIDEVGEIIAGHGRVAAVQVLNLATVPVIRLCHMSAAQKMAYRLADNKIAENGGWNIELLKLELEKIESNCENLDLSVTGFDSIELDVMLSTPAPKEADTRINSVPYIPENEIISRTGDVWQIGPHRIICGNSLDETTFTALMPSQPRHHRRPLRIY